MRLTLVQPTLAQGSIRAALGRRMLAGTVLRYGEVGHTSAGPLAVRPGALRFPDDVSTVGLTREHDRSVVRGSLALVDDNGERLYIAARVVDGQLGDDALAEALDRGPEGRGALSFDIENATVEDGVITGGDVVSIGQVHDPAFNSARIDQIAASRFNAVSGATREGITMTEEQRRRLAELTALNQRDETQETEYQTLVALAVQDAVSAQPTTTDQTPPADQQPAPAAASATAARIPAVPQGAAGTPTASTSVRERPFAHFARELADAIRAYRSGTGSFQGITAALADVTWSSVATTINNPSWSNELWSGGVYEPEFLDLLTTGDLTNFEGKGWRFTKKLAIQDYAGDKAPIPTDTIGTEADDWTAARMAVGVDIDRKFFDFPDAGFIASLFEQVRESWNIQLDGKVEGWIQANAVAAEGVGAQTDVLKAAALAVRALKRRRVGSASWVLLNDDDHFSLFDTRMDDVKAYLELYNIDPANFRASPQLAPGTVYAGRKETAKLLTLPGSPIRVEAQELAKGGVDEAFFGYWAVERHHKGGIAKVAYAPAP